MNPLTWPLVEWTRNWNFHQNRFICLKRASSFGKKIKRLMTLVQMRCFDVFWSSGICIMDYSASMNALDAKKYRLSNAILTLINNSNVNSLTWTFVQIALAVWRIFAQRKNPRHYFISLRKILYHSKKEKHFAPL